MENIKYEYLARGNREGFGRYLLRKGIGFSQEKAFGKAYEFVLEGLDFITCDCNYTGLLNGYEYTYRKPFEENNISDPSHEFFFLKAYLFSYSKSRDDLYAGLEAIEYYIELKNDAYGFYVKGRLLAALEDNAKALESLIDSLNANRTPRATYKFCRIYTGLEFILPSLFDTFLENPSSGCCIRVLQKHSLNAGIKLAISDERNPLVHAFNNEDNEWEFQKLFEFIMNNDTYNDKVELIIEASCKEILEGFKTALNNNSSAFHDIHIDIDTPGVGYVTYDNYDMYDYDTEDFPSKKRDYNDWIDDAFDGDRGAIWNID